MDLTIVRVKSNEVLSLKSRKVEVLKMSMNVFPQTNRTLLFEEINPEKLDLLTLIGSGKELTSLNDEKIKEINKELLVKSFDEFLEKFEPKIYSFFNAASQKIRYSLEKPHGIPEAHITEIPINLENTFFKVLSTLLDTKKVVGDKNVDFNFKDILNMLSPKSVMDDIKQLRKEISYIYDKYEELEEGDPVKLEYGDKLNLSFEKAGKNYNNILGMLPLAMEDIKARVLLGAGENGKKSEEIKLGLLSMDSKGELKILENNPKKSKALTNVTETSSNAKLIECFEDDYEEVSEESNDYVKSLVVRTFVPLVTTTDKIDYKQEIKNYNHYLEFYKEAQEDFIKVAKPLMEKLLGVKLFFEQYEKGLNGMQPSLLVANIRLEMLLKGDNKEALSIYLNTVNEKNDFENTVWFSIIPSVQFDEKHNLKNIRQRFKGTNKEEERVRGNTLENVQVLMDILRKYKVQSFFSMKANENTTFNNLATTGIEKYVEKTRSLQYKKFSEFVVPTVPNFTVIPKEKSTVILDYKLKMAEAGIAAKDEEIIKFWIEGVYVESAYVAAGVTAAYQCPEYLRKRFKKVDQKEPGVRINLESKDNSLKIYSTLSKEISGYTIATKDSINRNNFGYVFSSDNVQLGGMPINNITVYKSRTLATNEEGNFEPVYKTLTTTYIERILRFLTSDFKEDKVKDFFSNNPKSQKNKWLRNQELINSILQPGDDLTIEIDDNRCNLHISFNGDVKNLILDITKD